MTLSLCAAGQRPLAAWPACGGLWHWSRTSRMAHRFRWVDRVWNCGNGGLEGMTAEGEVAYEFISP